MLDQVNLAADAIGDTIREGDEFANVAHLIAAIDGYARANREQRARELLELMPVWLEQVAEPRERLQSESTFVRLQENVLGVEASVAANERLGAVARVGCPQLLYQGL